MKMDGKSKEVHEKLLENQGFALKCDSNPTFEIWTNKMNESLMNKSMNNWMIHEWKIDGNQWKCMQMQWKPKEINEKANEKLMILIEIWLKFRLWDLNEHSKRTFEWWTSKVNE